jgi:hypothetical protein
MKTSIFILFFVITTNFIPGSSAIGQIPFANAPAASPTNCVDGGTAVTTINCPQGTFSAPFIGGTLFTNGGNNGLAVGSVWRYPNVANNAGDIINATITVDAIYHAVLAEFDKDNATDENGNQTLQSFFAPRIDPDQSLGNTNRNGYVQFTIRFWKNNSWSVPALLNGINYSHYDIDGVKGDQPPEYWFRETGAVKEPIGNLTITVNNPTELIAYNYADGGNWKGYAGTVCNRSNFSRYAEVAATFKYPVQQSSVTIRMGYDYQDLPAAGTYGNQDPRLYASKFECFSFPQQSTLPVKLISFTGTYKNNRSLLNWTAENQVNLAYYDIERSINGVDFINLHTKASLGSANERIQYQYADDLTLLSDNVFYYRLKMIDSDGSFKYSNVIMIRKTDKSNYGISIFPNPIVNAGFATAVISATANSMIELNIIDRSGRVVLRQQNQVNAGNNSVAINNLGTLQAGIYLLRISDGKEVNTAKFVIAKPD